MEIRNVYGEQTPIESQRSQSDSELKNSMEIKLIEKDCKISCAELIPSYKSENLSPYVSFIASTPEQLAEKLLKASCCYCVFGKGQGMGCRNKTGTSCKEGILAYLQGKTLD